jgi:hypothetical protein
VVPDNILETSPDVNLDVEILNNHRKSLAEESKHSKDSLNKSLNLYSEDYYEKLVKQIFDDPKLDKKQLVTKILSQL